MSSFNWFAWPPSLGAWDRMLPDIWFVKQRSARRCSNPLSLTRAVRVFAFRKRPPEPTSAGPDIAYVNRPIQPAGAGALKIGFGPIVWWPLGWSELSAPEQ